MAQEKILIVGSKSKAALELIFKELMQKKGFQVEIFASQDIFLDYYNQSIWHKVFFRLGFQRILYKIQEELTNHIRRNPPSLVWVFKGMEIFPSTLTKIKNLGVNLVNYNPDHPFVFSGYGSGNTHVRNSVSCYNFYFSYADDVVNSLQSAGVRSEKVPFGFDHEGFDFREINPKDETPKICFLGNPDIHRVNFLNRLCEEGLPIDVHGTNWHKFKLHTNIDIFPPKYGNEFWFTLQRYAIQLNLLRPHNLASHNMRSFDIPGSGAIMLAPRTSDHQYFFKENTEVFLFDGLPEAVSKARLILNLSFDERMIIRKSARMRALEEHTYAHRLQTFLDFLNQSN